MFRMRGMDQNVIGYLLSKSHLLEGHVTERGVKKFENHCRVSHTKSSLSFPLIRRQNWNGHRAPTPKEAHTFLSIPSCVQENGKETTKRPKWREGASRLTKSTLASRVNGHALPVMCLFLRRLPWQVERTALTLLHSLARAPSLCYKDISDTVC